MDYECFAAFTFAMFFINGCNLLILANVYFLLDFMKKYLKYKHLCHPIHVTFITHN